MSYFYILISIFFTSFLRKENPDQDFGTRHWPVSTPWGPIFHIKQLCGKARDYDNPTHHTGALHPYDHAHWCEELPFALAEPKAFSTK